MVKLCLQQRGRWWFLYSKLYCTWKSISHTMSRWIILLYLHFEWRGNLWRYLGNVSIKVVGKKVSKKGVLLVSLTTLFLSFLTAYWFFFVLFVVMAKLDAEFSTSFWQEAKTNKQTTQECSGNVLACDLILQKLHTKDRWPEEIRCWLRRLPNLLEGWIIHVGGVVARKKQDLELSPQGLKWCVLHVFYFAALIRFLCCFPLTLPNDMDCFYLP